MSSIFASTLASFMLKVKKKKKKKKKKDPDRPTHPLKSDQWTIKQFIFFGLMV